MPEAGFVAEVAFKLKVHHVALFMKSLYILKILPFQGTIIWNK